jgi:hypothetical protein
MKKIYFIVFIVQILFVSLTTSATSKEKQKTNEKVILSSKTTENISPFIAMDKPVIQPTDKLTSPLFGKLLSNVQISKTSFNPAIGEKIILSYSLSGDANVSVNVYDSDSGLIKSLIKNKDQKAGKNTISWDGKDMKGTVVPAEAYFFTIEAEGKNGTKEVYDPVTFSGGIEHDIAKADIQAESNTVNYKLPEMGRVLIRTGIEGGPLLNTLVDLKPRIAGEITEYWNGRDIDNLFDLRAHPRFKMFISYFTLPENSVITYGNNDATFREYKTKVTSSRPVKESRGEIKPKGKISIHYAQLKVNDYSPKVKMKFLKGDKELTEDIPIIRGKTLVRTELDEKDNKYFASQQYEICFFMDGQFYAEEEVGYSPFNWVWNPENIKEGEHILTINLSGFKDQIAVLSRKIKVVKP